MRRLKSSWGRAYKRCRWLAPVVTIAVNDGATELIADLDKLMNVDDCKRARRNHLLRWSNGGFGSSDGDFFYDDGYWRLPRLVDVKSMSG